MHIGKMLGLALIMLGMSGCASFTKDEVAPVSLPSMANFANKPNVYVDFAFYQGEPKSTTAVEVPQARDMLRPQLQKSSPIPVCLVASPWTSSRSSRAITACA